MNKKEKNKLLEAATALKGHRRSRYISTPEIERMAEIDRKRSLNGKRIRVYSLDGFVSNSYKYPAYIDYVERNYIEGKKVFHVGQTGASRSYGGGALVTVNNRAY